MTQGPLIYVPNKISPTGELVSQSYNRPKTRRGHVSLVTQKKADTPDQTGAPVKATVHTNPPSEAFCMVIMRVFVLMLMLSLLP